MGTARRAKVWLIVAASATAVALATAAGAGASASFNLQTQTGSISRGDVIAAGGKRALVADPMVAFNLTQSFTETCTWADGYSTQVSGTDFVFMLFEAETRYAPGTQTITGYRISPSDIVDGETTDADYETELCLQARGVSDDDPPATQTFVFGPTVRTLTFFGPTGALELPFR